MDVALNALIEFFSERLEKVDSPIAKAMIILVIVSLLLLSCFFIFLAFFGY